MIDELRPPVRSTAWCVPMSRVQSKTRGDVRLDDTKFGNFHARQSGRASAQRAQAGGIGLGLLKSGSRGRFDLGPAPIWGMSVELVPEFFGGIWVIAARMSANIALSLEQDGWATIDVGSIDEDQLREAVLAIVTSLGNPVAGRGSQLVQALSPVEAKAANPSSLSAQFGTGEFPLHSDTAHWTTPARYIVLACVQEGDNPTPTYILDTESNIFDHEERNALSSAIYYVKNGKNSFYSSIISSLRPYFRYDPGCMMPINRRYSTASEIISQKKPHATEFKWRSGLILILDNWRVLHGRGASPVAARTRKLFRGLVA